ncbi:MAG TPA: alpha/beta fold hydrolase [Steroidobacteraceae bacterium]|nr:alpha/beta fold hydrolase [Steroidobacteraceae bacterium]
MQRRDVMKMSVGALMASSFGIRALGQALSATSAIEDEALSRRYDRERRFVATQFGRIAYVERGTGPVALFLHGFPLSSFQWRGVIEQLSGERRCIAPDAMGLGYTQVAPEQSLTPGAQADMLAAFLETLAIDRVDLIANDSGGAIAQLFLSRHPERVRTLLLTNCDVEIQSPPPALLPLIKWAHAGLYSELYLAPWVEDKAVARSRTAGIGGMCYTDPAHPTDAAIEQYLRPLVASAERKALVNRYLISLEKNPLKGLEPLLGVCKVPTRIVWGMADTIFSKDNPEYLREILQEVTGIRRLPKAKLFFPEEYPNVIAEEARVLWSSDTAGKG